MYSHQPPSGSIAKGASATARKATVVIVPAYCEAGAIGAVVTGLRRVGWQVIVVDDGSWDTTGSEAVKAGAVVLRHVVNLGQGAALRTGFAFALRQPSIEYVVTFDADGQHDPEAVEPLVMPLVTDTADVALGSRFLDDAAITAVPKARRLLLRLATFMARCTTGLAVTDSHNGLRAFRRQALERLELRQDRMAHASEIQHEIARHRLRYVEVPVHISYSSYARAKGQRATDAFSILWDLIVAKTR